VSNEDAQHLSSPGRVHGWDMTPEEFEDLAAGLLEEVMGEADKFEIERHTVLRTADGKYDIDATVRFELGGLAFLVLVEAKRHKNPIKRKLVAVLHQKMQSVGAQKAIRVSATAFQSGAVEFAQAHGIALATVAGRRLNLETKADPNHPSPGRGSTDRSDTSIPALVAQLVAPKPSEGSSEVTLLGTERLDYLVNAVFPDIRTL
jgi:Restriction endonuclease